MTTNTAIEVAGLRTSYGDHQVIAGVDQVRASIGVTGQFSAVDELLTGRENLRPAACSTCWKTEAGPAGPNSSV